MNKLILSLVFLFFALNSFSTVKIGYIDLKNIMEKSEVGKSINKQIKKETIAAETNLKSKEAELKKMKTDFDKEAMALSEGAKRKRFAEFQKKAAMFENEYRQTKQKLELRRRELSTPLLKKLEDILADIGKKEGYTVILQNGPVGGLLWAKDSANITKQVIKRMNKELKK